MKYMTYKALILLLLLPSISHAEKRLNSERFYQSRWCVAVGGVMEYRLDDKTRIDCLTATHAWEFDFGSKWAECLGQAYHYGFSTGKKPGCVLILEKEKDCKYKARLNSLIGKLSPPISLKSVGPADCS